MTALTRAPLAQVRTDDPIVTVGRLTLLVALVNSRHSPIALAITAAAMVLMFLDERRLRSAPAWLILAGALGALAIPRWWQLENHEIATVLWIAATGLALLSGRPHTVARHTARLMLGVIFAFAFGWKVLSSQYASTDFFRYTLVADERFEQVAEHLGGTDVDELEGQRRALAELAHSTEPTGDVVLSEGPRNRDIASLFTTVGFILEGLIALLYLLPLRRRFHWLRQGTIFLFCATTYAAMPVVGFGLLLLAMVATETESPAVRRGAVWASLALALWGFAFVLLLV